MKRIAIIGTSCTGKSTLAAAISQKLSISHVGLDHLHWMPDWVERCDDDFLALVKVEVSNETWVVDGNYSIAREIIWPRATTIVWLDYSFGLVLYRAVSRSFKRVITREKLFAGNVESFRRSFLSRESIILWVIQTHGEKRRKYSALLKSDAVQGKVVVRLTSQKDTDEYLRSL